jgi:probable HAF family extracellular repeat protein
MRPLPIAVVIVAASPALAQPHYEARILPGLGGTLARGLAVNNHGVVAGQATRTGQTYEVATAWVNGVAFDLAGSGVSLAGAEGVTDAGLVIGYTDQLGARAIQAVPPSTPATMIPQLQTNFSRALAINSNLDIVGSYTSGQRPFVMRSGVVTMLPLIGGVQGAANAISSTGIVAGWSNLNAGGGFVAVRWVNDQPQQLAGGASVNNAYGINDEGWTVGYVSGTPFTTYEASLWTGQNTRQNLGALPGQWNNIAYAINNHRQVVGTSGDRGFLWQDGHFYDLNAISHVASPWVISDAKAISDSGLIAGQVMNGGQSFAVLLVPGCSADFNNDGDTGTDADIEAFFACLAGNCCAACGSADFNGDGDIGTDADIESFFSVLGGGSC